MMRLFSMVKNNPRPFNFVPCDKVRLDYDQFGNEGILKYTEKSFKLKIYEGTDQYVFDHDNPVLNCYDDLHQEEEGNHYNSKKNVMASVIYSLNNLFIEYGTISHYTTNRTQEELSERYGANNVDRLKDMTNFIAVKKTKSMRG